MLKKLTFKDSVKRVHCIIILFLLAFPQIILAQSLQLAEIFNEGVVLQRNASVDIWGSGKAGQKVTVTIQGQKSETKIAIDGKWSLAVTNLKTGGPYTLDIVSSDEQKTLKEVYVGDVWIAGGQSNMEWPLSKSIENSKEVIEKLSNKNIRYLLVPRVTYEGHSATGDMLWRTATKEGNAEQMSGVAYFFAKEIQEALDIPIGIICCNRGGTTAEAWMSREKILENPDHAPIIENYDEYMKNMGKDGYQKRYDAYRDYNEIYKDSVKRGFTPKKKPWEPMGSYNFRRPNGMYNTMLKRIIPYTAKGVIWYQGESNASRAAQYQTLFPLLIEEWRSDFKNPDMPFYFVQISNYDHPDYNYPAWAELREAQLKTWQSVSNTGMVVSMDVGDIKDIHPRKKEPVGKRLAATILNNVYNIEKTYSGPIFKNAVFNDKEAVLEFDFIYTGLDDSVELKGFLIAGKNKKFQQAKAKIVENKVVVFSENVENPIAVRYNWANWAEGNLKNKDGFPASPFRTDNFRLETAGQKSMKYN